MLPEALAMAIAVIIGYFIKSNPKAKEYYISKLIPVFSFVILLLNDLAGQVADAATLNAHVMPVAFSLGGVFAMLKPVGKAALEAALVTGIHSAPKNVVEGVMLIIQGLKEGKAAQAGK